MLIDRQEISKHRELSKSVREDKIRPYIVDAQNLDVKPLLGESLYNAIVRNPEEHSELLDGGEYDEVYNQPGLRKVISIYAYARYIMFGSYTDTAFGFVEKVGQDSKSVSDSHKRTIYTQEQQAAASYFQEVANYMSRTNYEGWKRNNCAPRLNGRFRISKIS